MNCKKYIGLTLAFLILVSNIGWSFTMHYCGGALASVSVQTLTSETPSVKSCCAPLKLEKDSCCKNKKVEIEKKSENATLKAFSFESYIPCLFLEHKTESTLAAPTFNNTPIATYFCDANAPPLFKLYHHYIFYA